MIRPGLLAAAVIAAIATPACAQLNLCNRTSYRVEAAIGLQAGNAISTRGWFQIDPGQCRRVLEETGTGELVYIHARTPAVYGAMPLPQNGETELCVGENNFAIADARTCKAGRVVRFSAVKPSDSDKGPTTYLAEDADYDDAQARLAGIQRLLGIIGYDASPIDGVAGAKTDAAIVHFLKDRKLPPNAAQSVDFFDKLTEAAEHPEGHGFAWCNETTHTVLAAFGIVEMGSITTRGWYRIESGKCLRPEIRGDPHRLYSYAEAIDDKGHTLMRNGEPTKWGGNVMLCVRDARFEISNQNDCAARNLTSAGFAAIDIGGKPATTVRFKDP
ncbi:MAG TPA: DUF1036 domain-containing protein [Pseudolabrys sp.]|nr:DUF1036 domain-containing protein [Pseudolabrys sp.]